MCAAIDSDFLGLTSYLIEILLSYGPKVLSAFVILVAGWVSGKGAGWLVRGTVSRWSFGPAFKKTSIGRAILLSGYTPSLFFGSLARWCVYLIAIYEAIEVLEIPPLRTFMREIVLYLPYFISGLLILIVGFIFADSVGDIVKQAGGGSGGHEYYNPFGDAVRIFLYFVVLVMALVQMKIDVTILYIFAQAFAWSIAIAVAIALGWHLKDRVGPWIDQMLPRAKRASKEEQDA
jgi:hypothetical protein